jgi:hypothetical protein
MDQADKVRPSLPSIYSLLEHVSEQSAKGVSLLCLVRREAFSYADKRQEMLPLQHSIPYDGYREAHMDME